MARTAHRNRSRNRVDDLDDIDAVLRDDDDEDSDEGDDDEDDGDDEDRGGLFNARRLGALEQRRRQVRDVAVAFLEHIREQRGASATLTEGERIKADAMAQDVSDLTEQIAEYRSNLKRHRSARRVSRKISRSGAQSGAEARGQMWAADTADRLRAMGGESRAVVSGSLDVPILLSIPVSALPFPKRLIDVLGNRLQLDSPGLSYEFYKQLGRVGNAAPVPDLAEKPVSELTITAIQDRCRVIATLSDYVAARIYWNFESFNNWLVTQLYGCVLDGIESQVVSGDGTGENMVGILNEPGTTAVAFDTDVPTTLRSALSAMQQLGEQPTAWCLNPVDAQGIDLTRWGASGGFLSGGFEHDSGAFGGSSANIFGPNSIARIVTPHLPQGTAILADFNQLLLVFQQFMRLDIDAFSGFSTNAVRFRSESFCGVGILRPQAFGVVALAPSA